MTTEPDDQYQVSERVQTLTMTYPDQHAHNPDLLEEDWLEEPLKAVQVGPRQWRLEQNPIFSEAISYRDIVEGDIDDKGSLVINRIVERSPFRTVRTMAPRMLYESDQGKAFLDRIMELGGMWDSFALGIFVFSYPEQAHDEMEELFRAVCQKA